MWLTKQQAQKRGYKTYFTGKPCKRGHVSERYTSTSNCIECSASLREAFKKRNPNYYKNYSRTYREENASQCNGYSKRYHSNHPDYIKLYREHNRERCNNHNRTYRINNPHKIKLWIANRRASKLLRTPQWLTEDDKNAIQFFYECCPRGWEVDHIIPLQGNVISGLHVPENLQWLSKSKNSSKGNYFEITS